MEHAPILARFIIEILGAPVEFIGKRLKEHVEQIRADGYDVQFEKYASPVPKDKLFTQFVELKVGFKNIPELFDFSFDNMPSSIEIIKPEKLELEMGDLEDFLNDFAARLHQVDMLLKGMEAQKITLDRNALNVFHNFIKFVCKVKPSTIKEIALKVGLTEKALTPFVENLVKKGTLKKEGETFVANG